MAESNSKTMEEEPKTKTQSLSTLVSSSNVASRSSLWQNVKPFMNGALSGFVSTALAFSSGIFFLDCTYVYVRWSYGPKAAAFFVKYVAPERAQFLRKLPFYLFYEPLKNTARLGSYQFLSKRVQVANDGRPLTLYEEVGCGVASGVVESTITYPLCYAHLRMRPEVTGRTTVHQWDLKKLFQIIHHTAKAEGFFSLWRRVGVHAVIALPLNVGMLPSYHRSFAYFKESLGFTELQANLGAGAVSGFSAAICCSISKSIALKELHNCHKEVLRQSLPLVPYAMLAWISWEKIQKIEKAFGI